MDLPLSFSFIQPPLPEEMHIVVSGKSSIEYPRPANKSKKWNDLY